MQQAEIRAVLLLSVVNAFEKPLGSTFNNHSGSSNLWLKYIFIHWLLFISVWSQIMWLILIFICGYFAQHRWYEARIEMISNIFFVAFLWFCAHTKTFSEWYSVAMQHETLCAEHIIVGYPRAGASLNTSHKPFTTWWGKLLPSQRVPHTVVSITARLDTNCWKGVRTSSSIIFVDFVLLHFPHYRLRWKLFQHQSIWLIGLQLESAYLQHLKI